MIQFSNLDRIRETGECFKKWVSLKMAVIFIIVLVLFQCKSGTGKYETGNLAEIDISKKYPVQELYLQNIAKVEYIPLETNKNTLMRSGSTIVHVSDDYIIASNKTDGDVFVFDGKGKSKFSFNRKGPNGAMEYRNLIGITFDEKAKEIFIYDGTNNKWFVYAEDGKLIRTFACHFSKFSPDLYNFDDETLFAYDEFGVMFQARYSNKPYCFISKKDGSIVDSLNIYLPFRVSNWKIVNAEINGKSRRQGLNISMTNNKSYGKNYLIADWSHDTIYRLTPQKELQPLIVRKPSVQDAEPKIIISNYLATDKFILLGKVILDFERVVRREGVSKTTLKYDFETGQINECKLINKHFEAQVIEFKDAITPENTCVALLDVALLFEENEAGKIKDELKELLKTLDEEDNPVLMKIKF